MTRGIARGRASWRSALTLTEIGLALAIAAIVVAVAVKAYWYGQENARFHATTQEIGTLRAAVASRYGLTFDFRSLTNRVLSDALPASLLSGNSDGDFNNPFRGLMAVGPDTVMKTGDSFYISASEVDAGARERLVRADLGRDATYIRVDADNALGPVNHQTNLPLSDGDLANLVSVCRSRPKVSVSWQFYGAAGQSGVYGGCTAAAKTACQQLMTDLQNGVTRIPSAGSWGPYPPNWTIAGWHTTALGLQVHGDIYDRGGLQSTDAIGFAQTVLSDIIGAMNGDTTWGDMYTSNDLRAVLGISLANYANSSDSAVVAAMGEAYQNAVIKMTTAGKQRGFPGF